MFIIYHPISQITVGSNSLELRIQRTVNAIIYKVGNPLSVDRCLSNLNLFHRQACRREDSLIRQILINTANIIIRHLPLPDCAIPLSSSNTFHLSFILYSPCHQTSQSLRTNILHAHHHGPHFMELIPLPPQSAVSHESSPSSQLEAWQTLFSRMQP